MYSFDIIVIIPVWNDKKRVIKCIEALNKQKVSKKKIKLIVIDNGSNDKTYEEVEKFIKIYNDIGPEIQLIKEEKPGSYRARMTGLSVANGQFVAFTDSDCVPAENWLEEMLNCATANPGAGVVAGRVDIFAEGSDTDPSVLEFERFFSFDQENNVRRGVCVTANWLSPRSVLEACGGFDVDRKSGADWALSRKISEAGWPVVYAPSAVVKHPARGSFAALASKRRRVVGGAWHELKTWKTAVMLRRATTDCVRRIMRLLKTKEINRKAGVLFVIIRIYFVVVSEIVRLSFGGAPRR